MFCDGFAFLQVKVYHQLCELLLVLILGLTRGLLMNKFMSPPKLVLATSLTGKSAMIMSEAQASTMVN